MLPQTSDRPTLLYATQHTEWHPEKNHLPSIVSHTPLHLILRQIFYPARLALLQRS